MDAEKPEKSIPVELETSDKSDNHKNDNESQEMPQQHPNAQDQDPLKTEETQADGEKQDKETAREGGEGGGESIEGAAGGGGGDDYKPPAETEDGEKLTETEEEQASQVPPDLPQLSLEIDEYINCLSDESSKPERVPICVEQFAVLFDSKLDEYESPDEPVKWRNLSKDDAGSFLDAVLRISRLLNKLSEFSSDYQFHYSINHIGRIHQRSMSYLEEEFKSMMEDYQVPDTEFHEKSLSSPKTPHSSQENPENEAPAEEEEEEDKIVDELGYSGEQLSSLRKLSKAMIAGGYETECCQVYFITRRNILEVTPHKFGFQKLSIDDVLKMSWETLEKEIPIWIKTFHHYATSEFPRERKIADSIFPEYPRISETIFCRLSRGVIVQLINFSEAVAMTKRAAEKLFKFLDVYETLRDVLPVAETMFPEAAADDVKSEATLNRSRLGEAMISIFSELENSIKVDSAKIPVPGGAVHPLTRYTVNYLKYVCEYKDTLEHVFREHWKIERADSGAGSDYDYTAQQQNQVQKLTQSPFQAQLIKVMDLLDANLEAKSTLYKDPSLSSIFMMNNGRYILQKVRGSPEISAMMGDTWCRKRSSDLRQYHKNYQRETWGKLIAILTNHEGLYVNGKVIKPVLKERFKSFNAMFDEIHRTQSSWVVSDEQLQSELRVSISNMVIPAYRAFLSRYGGTMTPGRQTDKYVKYQADDIETYVDELFDGNTNPPPGARRR